MAKQKHHYYKMSNWDEINSRHSKTIRDMQNYLTDAEAKMKEILESEHFSKYKFQCKQPLGPYIVDFYSKPFKLIIEVEHEDDDRQDELFHDLDRIEFFDYNNIKTICFSDRLILSAPTGLSLMLSDMLDSGFLSSL